MTTEASLVERIASATAGIRERVAMAPRAALSLGSGDAGRYFARHVAIDLDPLLGPSNSGGSYGELIFGELGGIPVVLLNGGTSGVSALRESTLPVRIARAVGAGVLIVGGRAEVLNPAWDKPRLMLITDHINLLGANPLVGANHDELGPRFPDMSEAYDVSLRRVAEESARERGIQLLSGVYIGRTGMSPAEEEAELLRDFGGDAVGTGIVPEVIVAVHGGMRVVGLTQLERRGAESARPAPAGIGGPALEIIASIVQRL